MYKKPNYLDCAVMVLASLYFALLLSVVDNRGPLGWDEAARSMGGVALVRYFTAGMPLGDFLSALGTNHYYVLQGAFLYGPLHALSSASSFLLFGFSAFTARIPAATFGALGIIATYLLALSITRERRTAILASIFLIASPIYFDFSTMQFSEIPILFSITMGTYLLFKSKNQNSPLLCALLGLASGILFALAALTKPSALFMTIPIGIYIYQNWRMKAPQKKPLFDLVLPIGIFASIVIAFWTYLESYGALQQYISFWMGGQGYHPETEPLSLIVLANSWKPYLSMFPISIILLSIAGVYCAFRQKPSPEKLFLLTWPLAYLLSQVASGAVNPHYPLPAAPAITILASIGIAGVMNTRSNWKRNTATILIAMIVLQAAMVPIYKSISLREGNENKGEAYNPLILRTHLQKQIPSLYWINTRYYNGSSINFYARNSLDEGKNDVVHAIERKIIQDIQENRYQNATIMLLSEKSNYFDFLLTADDHNLTYKLITIEPDGLPQVAQTDNTPKYLVTENQDGGKKVNYIYVVVNKENTISLKKLWSG